MHRIEKKEMTRIFILCFILVATCSQQGFAYNAVVSKQRTGPGVYKTITAALAAAPTKSAQKYYIHVEAGTYVERVEVTKSMTNIVFIGDGAKQTTVQWHNHVPQVDTSGTGTLIVDGFGFVAKYITFENTAGEGFQAAAAVVRSSETAFYKCRFIGFQDTLYAGYGTQFYKECDIYGTVDFIFGQAAAVFQSCNLFARVPRTITFTAQDRDPTHQGPSGFVIQGSRLTVAQGQERTRPLFKAFLGRPWSSYSTVVVMESYIDAVVQPTGWMAWPPQGTNELTYLEYKNYGPGAATGGRVKWGGYHDVSGQRDKVERFTLGNFINQDRWIHSTGIPYTNGFMS